jgi:hypothetical protein
MWRTPGRGRSDRARPRPGLRAENGDESGDQSGVSAGVELRGEIERELRLLEEPAALAVIERLRAALGPVAIIEEGRWLTAADYLAPIVETVLRVKGLALRELRQDEGGNDG